MKRSDGSDHCSLTQSDVITVLFTKIS